MKNAFAILGVVLLAGVSAFAQTAQPSQPAQSPSTQKQGYPTEAYVKNIPVFKILVHPLGYKILYLKSDMTVGELYVPLKWFNGGPASTAEITYGFTTDRPYVSIAWVDGKFDHISINAQQDMMGPTWGTLNPTTDLSAQFNIQEPPRDY